MKNGAHALSLLVIAVACALTLLACGGGGNNGGTGTVTSVAITPTTATVSLNETAEFSATVNLNSSSSVSTSTAVTWEVNGVAGGSSTTGTIVASSTDVQVGIYTAPAVAPGTNNNEMNITAVAPQNPGSTTNTATVTSNTAVVTIGGGLGLAVTPISVTVPAGGTRQFAATLNGLADPNATWSVSSTNGGAIGSIDTTGLYTAPDFPPPGASITVTASDPTVTTTATATATITYSDKSLDGPFAFSYTGNDSSGWLAAAGSFVADGQGNILSGVEDVESFFTGVSAGLPFSGTYTVGPDGRTTAIINNGHGTATWQFALTTNQHAVMIRLDANATGSGTIDQQNLNDLGTSDTIVSGPYVFSASGTDANFHAEAMAGRFSAGGGNIAQSATILDVNDAGVLASGTSGDTSLHGSYQFDTANAGTGRGTLTLTSQSAGTLQFAFYVIDSTHLHIIEIDGTGHPYLAGDVFSGVSGSSFTAASLSAGTYAFTSGGTSATVSGGAYGAGGLFTSDGGGHVTGGALDTNNAGTVTTNATVASCPYSVDGTTGRIALMVAASCPASPNFAAYQTSQGPAVVIELDSTAVSTGVALQQNLPASPALSGAFVFVLAGQGMFHEISGSAQPEAEGQITVTGTSVAGNLDIDNFNAAFKNDPLNITTSSITAPGTNGRGTAVLEGIDPDVTYKLVYYLVDGNTALAFDQDTTRVVVGSIARQF
ncbi:MAG: hypothetical protein ABSE45_00090 [Candidatus Acidiferrales bacterium]|jgi:hypothetical protein